MENADNCEHMQLNSAFEERKSSICSRKQPFVPMWPGALFFLSTRVVSMISLRPERDRILTIVRAGNRLCFMQLAIWKTALSGLTPSNWRWWGWTRAVFEVADGSA